MREPERRPERPERVPPEDAEGPTNDVHDEELIVWSRDTDGRRWHNRPCQPFAQRCAKCPEEVWSCDRRVWYSRTDDAEEMTRRRRRSRDVDRNGEGDGSGRSSRLTGLEDCDSLWRWRQRRQESDRLGFKHSALCTLHSALRNGFPLRQRAPRPVLKRNEVAVGEVLLQPRVEVREEERGRESFWSSAG